MNRVSKNVPLVWVYGRKKLRLPSIGKQGYHGNGRTLIEEGQTTQWSKEKGSLAPIYYKIKLFRFRRNYGRHQ
jgi:hypothetical protein